MGLGDGLRCQIAAGAGLVVDQNALAQSLRQSVRDQPAELISDAPGGPGMTRVIGFDGYSAWAIAGFAVTLVSSAAATTARRACLPVATIKPLTKFMFPPQRVAPRGPFDFWRTVAALQRRPLQQVTSTTIVAIDQLLAQIEQGSERGWYETQGEGSEGVSAFAVSGKFCGRPVALSLAGPSERMNKSRDACLRALQDVCSKLLAND